MKITQRGVIVALAGIACALAWWFWAIDWFSKPGTYRISVLYTLIVISSAGLHIAAFKRFHHMVKVIRVDEEAGFAEKGSTLFAYNQRFRYTVRIIESAMVLVVGVTGIIAVHRPEIAASAWYSRLLITYLVGSIAATGYLTYRDLHVLNVLRRIDEEADDNVHLATSKKQAQ